MKLIQKLKDLRLYQLCPVVAWAENGEIFCGRFDCHMNDDITPYSVAYCDNKKNGNTILCFHVKRITEDQLIKWIELSS